MVAIQETQQIKAPRHTIFQSPMNLTVAEPVEKTVGGGQEAESIIEVKLFNGIVDDLII
jgi:hypothetical protein